jgi:tRNA dimethylallyltransferase
MFGAGVIEEVEAIGDIGPTASQALGFREIRTYLAGKISRADCLASVQQSTRRYAKRQMTWFRREPELEAVDLGGGQTFDRVVGLLAERVRGMTIE